ncbi:putative ribonuclease H-like domain-containing protein [Tanacetum coccineum]
MSFNDLYNNFKIVEQEVKGTTSSSLSLSFQNMAFVSSPSSTNEVNTAKGVSTANTQVSPVSTQVSTTSTQDLEQIHEDDIEEMDLKWQLTLLSMRTRRFFQKTGKNITINRSNTAGCDKSKFEGYGPKPSKSISEDTSNEVRESPDAPLVEELVSDDKLEKKTVFPTVAKIEFVRPKQQEKQVRKPVKNMVPRAVLMKTGLKTVNTARPVNTTHPKTTVYSARPMPKAVNTARPNSAVVNAVRANQCHPQKEYQGYVDSGCSRHMTGNMSYLSDFKKFDEGYVTFRGGAKRGKITSKGTLKAVPRKNNMYSVDIKNIIPKESLTCLVAKATLDESMIWHKRLGHVNFKTINKLVKENLMRGLPSKRFENDQTCVACLKAKAVNTACYVQNRVLVVKPHNKTPYELFRGRTPALSFMRLFGCHATILNTLDYLGKFDGKSDEELFVGYSLNSKAFRVYNIRTRKVEENLHIRFLEDKPIIAGDGPKLLFDIDVLTKSMNYVPVVGGTNSNDFVGTEESIGTGHSSKETGSSQDYILMPIWKDDLLFDSSLKNAGNDKPQPSSDAGKKDDEGVCKENGIANQNKSKNSTQGVNTAGPSINTKPDMFSLGDNATAAHVDFFGDETEVDMSSITTTYPVPSTPNTRIHKDHLLDHRFQ